jgi:hypothetical protein
MANKQPIKYEDLPPKETYVKSYCPYKSGTPEYVLWYYDHIRRVRRVIKQRTAEEQKK